jgi:hypothetical protein
MTDINYKLVLKQGVNIQLWKKNSSSDEVERSYINFESILEFKKWYEKVDHQQNIGYFEVIEGSQKIYMDLDCPKVFGICDGIKNEEDWNKSVNQQVNYIREVIPDAEVLKFFQSNSKKWSTHLIVKNYYVEDNNINKSFFKKCNRVKWVDSNVYHNTQMFRLIYSYKGDGVSNCKTPENNYNNIIEESLITNINGLRIWSLDDIENSKIIPNKNYNIYYKWSKSKNDVVLWGVNYTNMSDYEFVIEDINIDNITFNVDEKKGYDNGKGYVIPIKYKRGDKSKVITIPMKDTYFSYYDTYNSLYLTVNKGSKINKIIKEIMSTLEEDINGGTFDGLPDEKFSSEDKISKIVPKITAKNQIIVRAREGFTSVFDKNLNKLGGLKNIPRKGKGNFVLCVKTVYISRDKITLNVTIKQMIIIDDGENNKKKEEILIDFNKLKI